MSLLIDYGACHSTLSPHESTLFQAHIFLLFSLFSVAMRRCLHDGEGGPYCNVIWPFGSFPIGQFWKPNMGRRFQGHCATWWFFFFFFFFRPSPARL